MVKLFRMFRGRMRQDGYGSGYYGGESTDDFVPTQRTFKARTQKEATKKMDKFLRGGRICGSFFVKEA